MMIEFESSERKFRAKRLPPKKAWHCMRRIMPLLEGIKEILPALKAIPATASKEERLVAVLGGIGPITRAIAAIPDADSDFVFDTCMAVTQMQQAGTVWAPLTTPSGVVAFDNLELNDMLVIVSKVLQESLRRFFSGLPSAFSDAQAGA